MKTLPFYSRPCDVGARAWVIGLEPELLHLRVCHVLQRRTEFTTLSFAIAPRSSSPGLTRAIWPMYPLLPDVVKELRERGYGDGLSLPHALVLLERLTIRAPTDEADEAITEIRGPIGPKKEERLLSLAWFFRMDWLEWCLAPENRDTALLTEYELVYQELVGLNESGTSVRSMLRKRIDSERRLRLGPWSCDLPCRWETRCTWQESPSEWAEFLLAIKHRSHTRDIKEQLAQQRRERQIAAAWAAYGRWLSQHPTALGDLRRLLGVPVAGPAVTPVPGGVGVTENRLENSDVARSLG